MKSLFVYAITISFVVALYSCKTKEEEVIERFDTLINEIETKGATYSITDWGSVVLEYKSIHSEMEDCHFNDVQLRDIGEKEGKFSVVAAREGSKNVIDKIGDIKTIADGIVDGIEKEYQKDDFKEVKDKVQNLLK